MKYRVYCGMLDWCVDVEADSEEEAIKRAKRQVFSRLDNDATWWGVSSEPAAKPSTGDACE